MMLEDQLKRYWFFKYTGGFSVKKKSKSITETLNYTQELLSDGKNLVLIFPHGQKYNRCISRIFNLKKALRGLSKI
jgi:hypothetical protein